MFPLELGDRIAVINVGHIEQIGTPYEVYCNPATEYVATFLGAANLLPGVFRDNNIEVGTKLVPFRSETSKFKNGQALKLVFRPEDVSLSTTGELPAGHSCIANGIVEEKSFVGAYERLNIRIDLADSGARGTNESPFFLTTEAPESPSTKPIIATRPKPGISTVKLNIGDRVTVGLSSFTVLADPTRKNLTNPTGPLL